MTRQEVKILPGVETLQQIFTAEMFAQQIYINGQHIYYANNFSRKNAFALAVCKGMSLSYIYRPKNVKIYISNAGS